MICQGFIITGNYVLLLYSMLSLICLGPTLVDERVIVMLSMRNVTEGGKLVEVFKLNQSNIGIF